MCDKFYYTSLEIIKVQNSLQTDRQKDKKTERQIIILRHVGGMQIFLFKLNLLPLLLSSIAGGLNKPNNWKKTGKT